MQMCYKLHPSKVCMLKKFRGLHMNKRKKILIPLILVFMIVPVYLYAAKGVLSDDAQMCLGCHSNKDMTKQLENKEILSLFINGDRFADSIHNATGCGGCHTDISMENHPQVQKVKSKKEYSANNSKTCAMCHMEDQLKQKPMHGYLVTKAKSISCSECHGAHYIKSIKEWKGGLNEPQYCLACHKYDLSMPLSSGELLHLSVNESAMKASVHGKLSCGACHMEFSKTDHPMRTFKNKKEYTATAMKACTICHTDAQLRKNPAHSALMAKASCVECHGSHAIKGISAQKATAPETQYCLSCHKSKLSMTMKNGESLSIYVDEAGLKKSAHRSLQCANCHIGFTKSAHPVRSFKSTRDYSLFSISNVCKKCHANASTQYEGSIHYSLLNSGNPKAPACADCHGGAHSVASVKNNKSIGLTSCNKCHGDMNSSYEVSIHGKAWGKGNQTAPICSSCHNAHNIESTKMTTKIKDGCLKCHKDTEKVHNKWLSNPPITLPSFARTHFDVASCAACHSPMAGRVIYLSLYDRKTGKPLPEEDLLKALETDSNGLMTKIDTNADGSMDAKEVWDLFAQLYKKDVTTTFMGKMDVSKATEAHMISGKAEATKDCEKCHHPQAEFFKDVFIVLKKADGKPTVLNAKKEVLNSIYTILPARKFYALGSTNIKLFDILFIVALIGGIAVPIGHITLRIITSPLRSMRKMGKGGKK
ncbi:MAG: cytochrome c family protein [Nitrospira sp.]|nr:cytochrome c family protein [Nitrospira sp.]